MQASLVIHVVYSVVHMHNAIEKPTLSQQPLSSFSVYVQKRTKDSALPKTPSAITSLGLMKYLSGSLLIHNAHISALAIADPAK